MSIYTTLALAMLAGLASAADPACEGIRPSSRQQFCCGGIIYFDPNFLYTCCDGKVCEVDPGSNVVVQPTQPPQTTQPPPRPVLPVIVQPQGQQPVPIQGQQAQNGQWLPWSPFFFNPFNPSPQDNLAIVPRPAVTTTTQSPSVFCDGVDLTQLQKVQPSLACCGNQVVYDTRYYTCGSQGNNVQPQLTTTMSPNAVSLPTAFQPIPCDQNLYYVDPRIASFYKCCASTAYDSRTETCQQAYRLMYQPTNTYRVQPLDPAVAPQRSMLSCGATKYIFATPDLAQQYTC